VFATLLAELAATIEDKRNIIIVNCLRSKIKQRKSNMQVF